MKKRSQFHIRRIFSASLYIIRLDYKMLKKKKTNKNF